MQVGQITAEEYFAIAAISHSSIMAFKRGDGFDPKRLASVKEAMALGSMLDRVLTEQSDETQSIQSYKMMRAFLDSPVGATLGAKLERKSGGGYLVSYSRPQVKTQTVYLSEFEDALLKIKMDIEIEGQAFIDLKITTCETDKSFRDNAIKLGYVHQIAYYMWVSGYKKAYLNGISKHEPHKTFLLVFNWTDQIIQNALNEHIQVIDQIINKYKNGR